MFVLDLIELMEGCWEQDESYPCDQYDHNLFKQYYSDQHLIIFKISSHLT